MSTESSAVKRLRDVHAELTREALVKAAGQRFCAQGFAHTSLDEVASDAGTTKGAIYHHFKDKRALFKAVYERLSQELIACVAGSQPGEGSPGEVALQAFLAYAGQAQYQKVLFQDGPVVLGAAECRAIDMKYSLGLLKRLIEYQAPDDLLQQAGSDTLARLLLALLVEAAQIIASATEPAMALEGVKLTLNRMIMALSLQRATGQQADLPADLG